jgi:KDO2-lipid IV(A) lauroyltransferase
MGNVPILPVVMERKSSAYHALRTYDPIFPDLEADAAVDAKRITQQVWDIIEANIREKPEQWFWHNRRWILTPLYTQTR